jgi:hypothetical protein
MSDMKERFPPDFNAMRAVVFDDTARRPRHLVGLASFVPYDSIPYVATVESDDAGETWSVGERLFDLEYLSMTGTTRLPFKLTMARDGSTLFATCENRLFVREPDGRWTRRPDIDAKYNVLAMADARNGFIELVPMSSGSSSGSSFYFTDDGAMTLQPVVERRQRGMPSPVVVALDSATYRMIYLDATPYPIVVTTSDRGARWDTITTDLPASQYGRVVWRDTAELYITSDGGVVHYSGDGGRSFRQLHGFDTNFDRRNTRSEPLPWTIGYDDRYIYMGGSGDLIGRFRMIEPMREPTVGVDIDKWIPRYIDLR